MNLLRRRFGGGGAPAMENAIHLYVRCNRCSAPVHVRIVEIPSSGFAWGDAGIGAAGMLAVVMLATGIGMAALHHRRARRFTATTR